MPRGKMWHKRQCAANDIAAAAAVITAEIAVIVEIKIVMNAAAVVARDCVKPV